MVWRAVKGDRVLSLPEKKLWGGILRMMCDFDIDNSTFDPNGFFGGGMWDQFRFNSNALDLLTRPQRIVLFAEVSHQLFDVSVPAPVLTAYNVIKWL